MRTVSLLSLLLPPLLLACSGSPPKPDGEGALEGISSGEEGVVSTIYGPGGGMPPKGEALAGERPPRPPPVSSSNTRCPEGFTGQGRVCHPVEPALVEARGACERERGELCQGYAETVLESLGAEHNRYEAATLEGGDDSRATKRFAMYLKNKVETAQRLGAAYQGVAALPPGPWRHHAQVQEGSIYDHLGDVLEALPVPGKLTDEQVELFRQTLNEKAAPLREKARTLYLEGVTGAAAIGLEDELIRWAQSRLLELDGDGG